MSHRNYNIVNKWYYLIKGRKMTLTSVKTSGCDEGHDWTIKKIAEEIILTD
jgi:hypothetical protein